MADQNRTLEIDVKLDNSDFKRKVKDTKKQMGGIGSAAKALGPMIAAAFGTAALVGFVKQTLKVNDELAKTADRLGVSTEAMAGFNLAAKLGGMNAQQMSTALQMMNRNVSEAAQGVGLAKDALIALNLSAEQLRQAGPEQSFLDIVSALEGVENAADRSSLAMDIFGRSGGQVLNLTAEGLKQARIEAEQFGTAISREEAAKMEAFNDEITRFQEQLQGAGNEIVTTLLPALSSLLQTTAEAANAFANFGNLMAAAVYGPIDENKTYAEELKDVNEQIARLEEIAKKNNRQLDKENEVIAAIFAKRKGLLRITQQEVAERVKVPSVSNVASTASSEVSGPFMPAAIAEQREAAASQEMAINNMIVDSWMHMETQKTAIAQREADARAAIQTTEVTHAQATMMIFQNLQALASTNSKKAFEVAKVAGIAESIVGTYTGATQAFKEVPYPLNFVASASIIAAGLANVQKIKSTKFGGSAGGGTSPSGAVGGSPSNQFGTAPIAQPGTTQPNINAPQIKVVNGGTLIGKIVEEEVMPAINDALRRGVSLDLEFN